MVGQRFNAVVLQKMVETDRVPLAMLFLGPSGSGKTTAARILGTALEVSDVIEIDAASNGGVDKIRELLGALRYSTGGPYRLVILDEAHSITKQGFEALLKTLEEPPENVIFVLTTTEPHSIPKTIRSRLINFQFRAVSAGDIAGRLAKVAVTEGIDVKKDLVLHIANQSDGNMRTALQSLDLTWRAEVTTLEDYLDATGESDPAPMLVAAMMTGDHARVFEVLDSELSRVSSPGWILGDLIELVRDLFILKAGGTLPDGQRAEVRKRLSARIDQDRLLLISRVLWDIRTKVRPADDARGNLELSIVLITEALSRGNSHRPPQPAVSSKETPKAEQPRKMTLAEMQRG